MAESDYGTSLTKGGVAVGDAMVMDWPELSTGKIATTNHNSGGWTRKIPSRLVDVGDITLMLLVEPGVDADILAEIEAATVSEVVLEDEIDTLTGDGFYVSIKKEAQDAQNPNAIRASVVIAFAGEIDIT